MDAPVKTLSVFSLFLVFAAVASGRSSFSVVVMLFPATPESVASERTVVQGMRGFVENRGQILDTRGHVRPDIAFTADAGNARYYFSRDRISIVTMRAPAPFASVSEATGRLRSTEGGDRAGGSNALWIERRDIPLPEGGTWKAATCSAVQEHRNFYYAHCPAGIENVAVHTAISYEKDGVALMTYAVGWSEEEPARRANAVCFDSSMTCRYWGTYIGGQSLDVPYEMTVDNGGTIYLTGTTQSVNFPASAGAFQSTMQGTSDIFVAAFSASGQRLWATYYGGTLGETSFGICKNGNQVVVCGGANSLDFPISSGSRSGTPDAFLIAFNTAGARLWAFLYGGSDEDAFRAVTTDAQLNIVVTGYTNSTDFPVTPQCAQQTFGGDLDAVLVKLTQVGSIIWSTYWGGDIYEQPECVVCDASGNIFAGGRTHSSNFPTSVSCFQSFKSGAQDGFVVKMSPAGAMLWSTYLGGTSWDWVDRMAVAGTGDLYISGKTESGDFPVSLNAFQPVFAGGSWVPIDAFLMKFDAAGNRSWGTFLGGRNDEEYWTTLGYRLEPICVALDADDSPLIAGATASDDFPVTEGMPQQHLCGPVNGFLTKFTQQGGLVWSTFLGGSLRDGITALRTQSDGTIILSGGTTSSDFPVTANAFQPVHGGMYDAFIAALRMKPVFPKLDEPSLCTGDSVQLSLETGGIAGSIQWTPALGLSGDRITNPIAKPDTTTLYKYAFTDLLGCSYRDSVMVRVSEQPVFPVIRDTIICHGDAVQRHGHASRGTPPYTVRWTPADAVSDSTAEDPILHPLQTTIYTVEVTDANGCKTQKSFRIRVTDSLIVQMQSDTAICTGSEAVMQGQVSGGIGAYSYRWAPAAGLDAIDILHPTARPAQTTEYVLTVTDSLGCSAADTVLVLVPAPLLADVGVGMRACEGERVTLVCHATGGTAPYRYRWLPLLDLSSPGDSSTWTVARSSTTYTVTVTDAIGCSSHASVRVEVAARPVPEISASGPLEFCFGDSVTLRVTRGYAKYAWMRDGTPLPQSERDTLCASHSGLYAVQVTDSNGCAGEDTIRVTARPAVDVQVIVRGALPRCEGDSVTLEAASGYRAYEWRDLLDSLVGNTRSLVVRKNGSYTVSATDTSACRGQSVPIVVTFHPIPRPAIAGAASACPYASMTYRCASSSGRTYDWRVSGGSILSGQGSAIVTLRWGTAGTGRVEVTETVDNTGCAGRAFLDVRIDAQLHPAIAGLPFICAGDTALLDAGEGYASFEWKCDGLLLASATGRVCAATRGGNYTVAVSDSSGCSGSASFLLSVYPAPSLALSGPAVICEGDTAVLDATGGFATYRWTRDGAALTETVSQVRAATAGTYALVVADSNGCTARASHVLTVHGRPLPAIDHDGPLRFCEGDSTVLHAGPRFFSCQWLRDGNLLPFATDTALTVRGSGTYTIHVTDSAGCTASAPPVTVTVLPVPHPVIAGPAMVCVNSSASYRVAAVQNGTYAWRASNGTVTGGDGSEAVTVHWGTAGAALLTVSVHLAECSGSDTLHVTVGTRLVPKITASGATTFCEGDSATLDAGDGYAQYAWKRNDTLLWNETGRTITATLPGIYSVEVRDATGCAGTDSLSISIRMNPVPVISGPSAICEGDTAWLDAGSAYASYAWYDLSGRPLGATRRLALSQSGSYFLRVTDTNGCTGIVRHLLVVYARPPQPSIARHGDTLASTPAITYQWFRNDTLLAGVTTREYRTAIPGAYTVTITDAHGCGNTSDPYVLTDVPRAAATLALPFLEAAPGERVVVPIALQASRNMEHVTGFTARLRFRKDLLEPVENTPAGIIENDDRIVSTQAILAPFSAPLTALVFRAMLGARASTALHLDAVDFAGAPVDVTSIDGSFTVKICREGGERLFDGAGRVQLFQNRPNPFNAMTVIEYETMERGSTTLSVVDMLGRRVALLMDAPVDAGISRVSFDASALPSGVYHYILQTPSISIGRMMLVVK